ncbi:MAG: T9SS type A sorting domain-containing protein, partial [Flavobacteriales bacterium]|nr:T9SS type A sorting domain-containing protein [Flavobacteriales bacterium]
ANALFGGALVGILPGAQPGDNVLDDLASPFEFPAFGINIPGFSGTLGSGTYSFFFKEGNAHPDVVDAYVNWSFALEIAAEDDDDNLEGSYSFERTFTVTATDACGNATTSSVTQLITVEDDMQPSIDSFEQLAAQEYFLDEGCDADLTPVVAPAHSESDACDSDVATTLSFADGLISQSCDGDDGTNSGSYSFTRTWILVARDDCGNQSTAVRSQSIIVTDATAPAIDATYPADYDTDFDANCEADGSTAAGGVATATASDNCDDDLAIEISHLDHDTTQLAVNIDEALEGGYSFIRTWTVTATDDCGNSTTVSHDQSLAFHDVIAPTAAITTLPTYGVYADADCNADVSPAAAGTPEGSGDDACDSNVSIDLTYEDVDETFQNSFGDYGLEIDTVAVDGILGMTTVRLYVTTENASDFLSAVAGDGVNPTVIRTTTSFYQDAFGATLGSDLPDLDPSIAPGLAYDSYVTIGLDGAPGVDDQPINAVGDWVSDFEAGGDIMVNSFYGGSWFGLYPSAASVAGADQRVLIAQLTTDGQLSGQVFAQVFPEGDGDSEFRVSFTFGDCAEDDDTPEGSYNFVRVWTSTSSDDANNQSSAVSFQSIQVSDTTAPQLTNTCGMYNGDVNVFPCAGIAVLDLDPVPVACDVTAIDNCDSDVNINLFIEESGHVPTSAIQNYCAPVTPEAQEGSLTCDERAPEAIRLFNFPGDEAFVIDGSASESMIEVSGDGALHIELNVTNADGTGGFAWSADYGAGLDWSEWSALGRSYKKDCNDIFPGETVWEDWAFFLMTSGTMEGTGIYAGSSMELSHQPTNGYFGLQAGAGANNKNTNYGASAWFFWNGQVVIDGQDLGTLASSGDVYMDLDCCLPWQVDYSYTAMDDCGNPTGFAYTNQGTAATAGSGSDISGGHTGPVDVGATSNLKEPIRITGLAPNPTNDHSQLTFTVNESMRLSVNLYTMTGLQVVELYDGNAMTGVQYSIDIDTDALSSGMYQIRISSNSYIAVKKLLVTD